MAEYIDAGNRPGDQACLHWRGLAVAGLPHRLKRRRRKAEPVKSVAVANWRDGWGRR